MGEVWPLPILLDSTMIMTLFVSLLLAMHIQNLTTCGAVGNLAIISKLEVFCSKQRSHVYIRVPGHGLQVQHVL